MQSTNAMLSQLPRLGSGLGYRQEIRQQIFEFRSQIDFLEIISDQFLGKSNSASILEELCEEFTVIPHGIGMSLGSSTFDMSYLKAVRIVSETTGSPFYSEHLAMTNAGGLEIGHLSPLWFTEDVLQVTCDNVNRVQDYLGKLLVIENVTYPFDIPGAEMTQEAFFHRLVETTNCGILLDITNVYINSLNHSFDPFGFIVRMPIEHVVQIHLAGGYWHQDQMIDGHSEIVNEEVWSLLERLSTVAPIRASILEHDASFPSDFTVLTNQLERARKFICK